MRELSFDDSPVTYMCIEHIITRNMWEYYVLENEHNTDDIKFCFVRGFEDEFGDVSMEEIKPYILLRTKNLDGVLPPPRANWID